MVVEARYGLRFTGVRRALADLLRAGPRDDAVVAVDSALALRTVDGIRRPPLTDVTSVAAELKVGLLGEVRANNWLRMCDPRAGSAAETMARLRTHDADLRPESQAELITRTGRRLRLDFLFREAGLAVEIEGYAYHGTHDAHRRNIDRFNQILQCPEGHRRRRRGRSGAPLTRVAEARHWPEKRAAPRPGHQATPASAQPHGRSSSAASPASTSGVRS